MIYLAPRCSVGLGAWFGVYRGYPTNCQLTSVYLPSGLHSWVAIKVSNSNYSRSSFGVWFCLSFSTVFSRCYIVFFATWFLLTFCQMQTSATASHGYGWKIRVKWTWFQTQGVPYFCILSKNVFLGAFLQGFVCVPKGVWMISVSNAMSSNHSNDTYLGPYKDVLGPIVPIYSVSGPKWIHKQTNCN